MTTQERADRVLEELKKAFPRLEIPLNHSNAHELLFATILSAQCTDVRVNKITPALFARYPKVADYAEVDLEELKEIIKSCGFYNNKAKNIQGAARKIMQDFEGKVPDTLADLLTLPGVAKKTASVVLWQWFNKNEGFTVDTHVIRLSNWFGLTKSKNADIISRELEQLFPQEEWGATSLRLILLGRQLLTARNPKYEGTVWEELMVERP